jgi:hypothetical protein
MDTKWFYKHAGHVFGPFARDEMHRLAALGLLQPDDRLWPEGSSRKHAQEARSAIDFDTLARPRLEAPDWLADVERAEASAAKATQPAPALPDWLDDVRQFQEPPKPTPSEPAEAPAEAPAEVRPAAPVPVARAVRVEFPADVYQRAQAALHAWADMDASRPVILSGDLKAVRRDVAIQVILQMVEKCGPQWVIRLWDHLAFIVDNRRKYYLARQQ